MKIQRNKRCQINDNCLMCPCCYKFEYIMTCRDENFNDYVKGEVYCTKMMEKVNVLMPKDLYNYLQANG